MDRAIAAKLPWRAASACGSQNCVQVAAFDDAGSVAVRDSKDPDGAMLVYSASEWKNFITGAKSGEFDNLA